MSLRTTLLALLLVVAAAVPSSAAVETGASEVAEAVATEALANSPNLTHVTNIKHQRWNNGERVEVGGRGSDVEFVDLDVTGLEGAPAGVTGVRRFALAGTIDLPNSNAGLQIIDITDPTKPVNVAVWDCKVSQGDIQIVTRQVDGVTRTYVGYGADYGAVTTSGCFQDLRAMGKNPGNGLGVWFADITNPYAPTTHSFVPIGTGAHNLTIHPSGNYLYNSSNRIGANIGTLEIFDITDLRNPVAKPSLNLGTGIDSHDVTFSADGKRAYSAAINHTLIINTENPASPTIIGRVVNAAATIHHQADPVTITHPVLGKRTFLVITDEFGGAAGNGFCPGGGLIIYDITGQLETAPVFVGAWFIPQVEPVSPTDRGGRGSLGQLPACTSHVLRFHPTEAIMTIGWYSAGVRVVDISNLVGLSAGAAPAVGDTGSKAPVGMRELGYFYFADSNSWAAKTPEITRDAAGKRSFYLFSNDIQRGFDVFRFDEAKTSADVNAGQWLTPAEYTKFKASLGEVGDANPWCSLRALQDA
jgi:hypothetical protein